MKFFKNSQHFQSEMIEDPAKHWPYLDDVFVLFLADLGTGADDRRGKGR